MDNTVRLGYLVGRFGKEGREVAEQSGITKDLCPQFQDDGSPVIEYKSQFVEKDRSLPSITCICVTNGRFSLLQRAVACFLLQDYENKKMIIVNDAPVTINDSYLPECINVINLKKKAKFIGDKKQVALESASTKAIANWDDDAVYFPWHLLASSKVLSDYKRVYNIGLVLPNGSWSLKSGDGQIKTHVKNLSSCDSASVFFLQEAKSYGGYSSLDIESDKSLSQRFLSRKELAIFNVDPFFPMVLDKSHRLNDDFGDFQLLIPDFNNPVMWAKRKMSNVWKGFLESVKPRVTNQELHKLLGMFGLEQ
jgi:hypothetical protein